MAMGFIKKMFSFGKKEVEEKPAEQPAPDAVEISAPDVTEAPVAEESVIVSEPEPIKEPAAETIEKEKAEPEHPVTEIEISIEQPPVMEPIAVEAPAPESVVEPAVEPEPEQPAIAKAPEAPLAEEAAAPRPEPVKPKKVKVSRAVEEAAEEVPAEVAPEPKLSWFERLRRGLARSSSSLSNSIGGIFTKRKLDDDTLQDLEDVLIQADLGLETAMRVTDALASGRYGKDVSGEEVRAIMSAEIEKVLAPVAKPLELDLSHKPHVILVVGVNGTGKTTTIGKLAAKLTAGGLKVMLAAGDTFRAAAIEQLHIWGERTGSPVVSSKLGADAAGLAYDAWEKAKEAGSDVLIIDTAGRLQNKAELMDELAKIVRVLGKHDPEAPHTVLQTLDATTGQNALNQVEIFKNVAGVNGLVMTKLDGTARGGILVAISARHKLPIYFIGVGEGIDDLEPFAAKDFARAIAGVA
ncbi:signal recognition particle-docking protein FtsY [Brucella neotomae]|uniref:Signal recognition particle receptor FtsY n=1 Tax=Brucella neotomae 5K33 TaxID=520456 RepID=A0A7U8K7B7_BRUNE|nr:signal recognition particle-docking protein FtsY [Brucella neotomae]EEY03357.1 signal recognition particle-docking protein FtsY [Brucella neotomae 5K33]KEY01327.1 cell division protein FtsY [Brucella neotomae 5K33]KFJ56475.1 signal recognition particle-docking protein FtsY [Brucella neotomae 5K33]SPU67069.1 signal recognition particle receptor [Brucella neotomae]SUW41446.1 signal recognition particle receptor [Brucella neotomae]